MLEEVEIIIKGCLKAILVTAQKGKESCRESFHRFREDINNHVQYISRNMDAKGHSDEVSDGNKKRVMGQGRKGNFCYKVSKNLLNHVYVLVFCGRWNLPVTKLSI